MYRENALGLAGWHTLADTAGNRADEVREGLGLMIAEELQILDTLWPTGLPHGVIHADLFPDNVLFLKDRAPGLIDFYFACNDVLAYDLAICLNAWCFEPDNSYNATKGRALIAAYHAAATTIVFFWHPHVQRVMPAVNVLDAAGLGLFCAVGTEKAMNHGLSPLHAALLGVTTAVGGGVLRDVLAGQIPSLLYDRQLYAVPAMLGSAVMALLYTLDLHGWPATLSAAVLTFGLRIAAMRLRLRAPLARGVARD